MYYYTYYYVDNNAVLLFKYLFKVLNLFVSAKLYKNVKISVF